MNITPAEQALVRQALEKFQGDIESLQRTNPGLASASGAESALITIDLLIARIKVATANRKKKQPQP